MAIPISQIMARRKVMGIARIAREDGRKRPLARSTHPTHTLENDRRFIYSYSIVQKTTRPTGAKGDSAMPVTHEPWLVALSLVVAIQGAYVGLSLAVQVAGA